MLAPWKKSYDKTREHIKKQRHPFTDNGLYSQSYGFSISHVWMWEMDHKEGWVPKTWCFWTVVLEKTLEGPLDCKRIKPVNSEGNQSWIFFGGTDAEAKVPILWPPDAKSWLIWKDTDAGKGWRQKEQRNHWLNGFEFKHAPGDGEWQGSLACCSSQGCKELDMTEQLNDNNSQLKTCTTWELQVKFYWGKRRTEALETAPQIALKGCSIEVVEEGQYVIYCEGGVQWNQALILQKVFCSSWGADVTMKAINAFLDVRRYKDWDHEIRYWKYLTI